jgi:hypothetical protein
VRLAYLQWLVAVVALNPQVRNDILLPLLYRKRSMSVLVHLSAPNCDLHSNVCLPQWQFQHVVLHNGSSSIVAPDLLCFRSSYSAFQRNPLVREACQSDTAGILRTS